jgi:hypothetical protein
MARFILALAIGLFVGAPVFGQSGQTPPISILQSGGQLAPGFVFTTPAAGAGASKAYSNGPEIIDNMGRPVWFIPLTPPGLASDLRVQTYQGNPVLTWSQGVGFQNVTPGATTDYIADSTYHVIATVQAGNGLNADQHEFYLTPQNTALITSYDITTGDLTSVGGPASGPIFEGVVQEIDVATGTVLLEWHSLGHVALTESYEAYTAGQTTPFDYFHINSVSLDTDGNLLVSSRHTWTVYKVNRTTGAIIWRLGGKKSDFALGAGLPFAWQHDAEAVDASTIRIFDNESDGTPQLPASRVIWVHHDDTAMTASVAQSIQHPAGLSALAEGSAQSLPNGDTYVGWGILGRFSEFDPSGTLLFDGSEPVGFGSYRGYRFPWVGNPTTTPTITALANADGTVTIHAIWNGATEVATWNVMGGTSSGSLTSVGTGAWNGLDTTLTVTTNATNLQVVAVDSMGATLGQSAVITGPFATTIPEITVPPISQTIASGDTVVFSVGATGGELSYLWSVNGSAFVAGLNGPTFSGINGPTLVIQGTTAALAGSITCTVSNSAGSVTSAAATLTMSTTSDVGRLIDVSCRSSAGSGSAELITGFAVGGGGASSSMPVLIRASGPALIPFNVPSPLADPELQLFSVAAGSNLLASDSGWGGDAAISAAAATAGAFAWTDPTSLDSALVQTLSPGPYTANILGATGDTGTVLAEVYDETPAGTFAPGMPHLTNVSARAVVGTGGNVLVAGFVIGGTTSKTVLIRASGPALGQFGLTGTIPDPALQLYSLAAAGTTLLASNDDWGGDPEIAAAASVGAFAWSDPASSDCALLVTLPPGAYTANITGINGSSGVALVEVYEVP